MSNLKASKGKARLYDLCLMINSGSDSSEALKTDDSLSLIWRCLFLGSCCFGGVDLICVTVLT